MTPSQADPNLLAGTEPHCSVSHCQDTNGDRRKGNEPALSISRIQWTIRRRSTGHDADHITRVRRQTYAGRKCDRKICRIDGVDDRDMTLCLASFASRMTPIKPPVVMGSPPPR